jgi:hypothetical protein
MLRSVVVSVGLFCVIPACSTGPLNGNVFGGAVVGKSILFQGFTDHPSELVVLEVLKKPSLPLDDDGNWAQFGSATTTTSPTFVNGNTDPLYYWSTNAAPVASAAQAGRWPTGGLIRTRARRIDSSGGSRVLTTFDEVTFSDCFTEHFSAG